MTLTPRMPGRLRAWIQPGKWSEGWPGRGTNFNLIGRVVVVVWVDEEPFWITASTRVLSQPKVVSRPPQTMFVERFFQPQEQTQSRRGGGRGGGEVGGGGTGITSVFTPPTTIFLVVVVAVAVVVVVGGGQIKVAGICNSPTNNVVWLILPITEYASPFLETLWGGETGGFILPEVNGGRGRGGSIVVQTRFEAPQP